MQQLILLIKHDIIEVVSELVAGENIRIADSKIEYCGFLNI